LGALGICSDLANSKCKYPGKGNNADDHRHETGMPTMLASVNVVCLAHSLLSIQFAIAHILADEPPPRVDEATGGPPLLFVAQVPVRVYAAVPVRTVVVVTMSLRMERDTSNPEGGTGWQT
jgi:hypothetical protein